MSLLSLPPSLSLSRSLSLSQKFDLLSFAKARQCWSSWKPEANSVDTPKSIYCSFEKDPDVCLFPETKTITKYIAVYGVGTLFTSDIIYVGSSTEKLSNEIKFKNIKSIFTFYK